MKRIISLLTIGILLIIIFNLSASIVTLLSKKDVLTNTKLQLEKDEKEKVALQQSLKIVNSPQFIEEQARDKLFLAKPGETIVLLPNATPSATAQKEGQKPNWLQWWELFF